jgi:hypothetical protein
MPHRELFLPDTVKTGGIILPPTTRDEIDRDRRMVSENIMSIMAVKRDFDRDLKQIDDHLEIVKAKDVVTIPGLKAGYWHIVRMNPGHPADILILEYPDGSYREPGSWVFDFVMESDLYNDRARKAHRERQKRAVEARERRKALEAEQRIYEMADRVRFRDHTQILVKGRP